jgi:adenine C2-methylase RlmN of 23S rRNA A2503 and tRNA A37
MTNISLNNQKIIKQNFAIILAKIIDINTDKKRETFKFLVQFHDKNYIEMVVMKFGYG